jgi:DNA-binding transcriptional regulator YdaS (Cro superfamily)
MAVLTGMDLLRAPANRGLRARIARELGIERGAIAQWRQIPPERVPEVSRITGIPRHQLRPDLWEPPDKCICRKPARAA